MTVDVLIFTDCASKAHARSAGAYRVATELRANGYSVQVVEHFLLLGLEKILSIIDKFVDSNTLMVGFSTTFMNVSGSHLDQPSDSRFQLDDVLKINFISGPRGAARGIPINDNDLSMIKQRILQRSNNRAKLVVGGSKADHQRQREVDAFVLGYADNSITKLVRYLDGKNPFFQYRWNDQGQMILDDDIDATGFDFEHSQIIYHPSDLIKPNEILPIEIARGCIFKCKFCAFRLTGKKKIDYIKQPATLYDELMRNYEEFGTTRYIFADDTYNDTVQKLEAVAEITRRLPFKIEYAAYLRHDLIWRFPEMADLLFESGLKSAIFGIETLNHQAGKLIGKGLDPALTRQTLSWLREEKGWKNNILMSSGFIIGLPTETKETITKWTNELLDESYPLDSFITVPLTIRPDAVRIGKSEFELDYQKYGYWFDSNKSSSWINEHWTYEDAVKLANSVLKKAVRTARIAPYGFFAMMLLNYGYTWEDIHSHGAMYFEHDIFQRTLKLADDYFSRLIAF